MTLFKKNKIATIFSVLSILVFSVWLTLQTKAATSSFVGHIDQADCNSIIGWAADRNQLNKSITVFINFGTRSVAVTANRIRGDVGAYLGDNGLHGFMLPIPDFAKTGQNITGSVTFLNGQSLGNFFINCVPPQQPSQYISLIINSQYQMAMAFSYGANSLLHVGDTGAIVTYLQNFDPYHQHQFTFSLNITDPLGNPVDGSSKIVTLLPYQKVTLAKDFDLPCGSPIGTYKASLSLLDIDGEVPVITYDSVGQATNSWFANFLVDRNGIVCP